MGEVGFPGTTGRAMLGNMEELGKQQAAEQGSKRSF